MAENLKEQNSDLDIEEKVNRNAESTELLKKDDTGVGENIVDNAVNEEDMGESKVPQLQNSSYCTAILLLTVITSVPMINYGLTCFNPTLPVLREIYNETYHCVAGYDYSIFKDATLSEKSRYSHAMSANTWEMLKSLTMSMIVAGAFVGSLSLKLFLSYLSRKQCMLMIHSINIVGAITICLGAGLTGAYELLIIGRFVMGFASGLSLGLVPVIIGETSVKHRCAAYDGSIGVCLAIGSLLGVIFGWSQVFGTKTLWPLIIAIPALPSVIYILLFRWLSETPHYVMRHGSAEEVTTLIKKLRYGSESALEEEIRNMRKGFETLMENNHQEEPEETSEQNPRKDLTLKDVFTTKQYRSQFIMVLLLFANLMLNGLNNVLFFSDTIFLQAGIKPEYVTLVTVFVFMFQVFATLPGSYILHRLGSWKLCIIGNIIMIVGHILVVVSLATYKTTPGMSYLAIVGITVYLLGFAGGENIGLFPLVGELTTEITRPICINFGCATLWFTGWLVGFMATYLAKWLDAYSFLIWMAFTIAFTIYIALKVPDTRKQTSEQIQEHFKND